MPPIFLTYISTITLNNHACQLWFKITSVASAKVFCGPDAQEAFIKLLTAIV